MTETSTVNGSATASAAIPELVDLLIDPIVRRPNQSLDRAAVIVNLRRKLCAAVAGLHGPEPTLKDPAGRKVASLRQLIAARQNPQRRMTTQAVAAAVGGRR